MADKSQFEKPFTCTDCEPRFSDMVDELLPDGERLPLESHVAGCESCRAALAEIRRGQAWLRLLRDDDIHLEPPAGLVDRILAATSGAPEPGRVAQGSSLAESKEAPAAPWASVHLPAVRRSAWYQPRLVLTAAMAFFSISLTMSVAGIRAVDLKPSNLRHTVTLQYFQANAHVVRYYENLRVVYELESRVRELRNAAEKSSTPDSSKPRKKGSGAGSSRGQGPMDPGVAHGSDADAPDTESLVAESNGYPNPSPAAEIALLPQERSRV